MMTLIVNGKTRNTSAETLDALLSEMGYEDAVVATALNSDFVPISAREKRTLKEGDRIEILAPMKGG